METENWIFDNATEEICCGCNDMKYSNALECLRWRDEECPYRAQLQFIELLSQEVLKKIDETAKLTHKKERTLTAKDVCKIMAKGTLFEKK